MAPLSYFASAVRVMFPFIIYVSALNSPYLSFEQFMNLPDISVSEEEYLKDVNAGLFQASPVRRGIGES